MKFHHNHFTSTANGMSAVLSEKYPCPVHLIASDDDWERDAVQDLMQAVVKPCYLDTDMVIFEDDRVVSIGQLRHDIGVPENAKTRKDYEHQKPNLSANDFRSLTAQYEKDTSEWLKIGKFGLYMMIGQEARKGENDAIIHEKLSDSDIKYLISKGFILKDHKDGMLVSWHFNV